MVVIEFSASWPRWLKPTASGDMAVVAQHYEGHPSSLVTQVATRTTRLEAVGWNLQSIVLVSNGRSDPDSIAARSVLARGLLSRLRLRGRGELLLTIDEKLGRRAGSHLRALGASLEHSLRGAHLSLGVRVGDDIWHASAPLADSVTATAQVG
jgi:hypothetical protein